MEIRDTSTGTVLTMAVQPSARKRELRRDRQGRCKLAVTEPPENGRANQAVIELLAEILGVRKSQITLIAGMSSRQKTFAIHGLKATDVAKRLGSEI